MLLRDISVGLVWSILGIGLIFPSLLILRLVGLNFTRSSMDDLYDILLEIIFDDSAPTLDVFISEEVIKFS